MMRKRIFLSTLLILAFIYTISAQKTKGNPFSHLGYKASVATFGDKEEFHDKDIIIEIGNVRYDTRTKEVVGFVEGKDPRITLSPEVISMSIDPLCEKYYSISPYVYVMNNPMRLIDPDGRDVWEINGKGEIINRIEDKTQDAFYMVAKNSNGDYQRTFTIDSNGDINFNSISFEYGTIKAVRTPTVMVKDKDGNVNNRQLTIFEMKGDDKATQLFEFFATPQNTEMEWTHAKIGTKITQNNMVGTSHEAESTAVGHYLRATNYALREVVHNHPSGIATPSLRDKLGAIDYHMKNPNTILKIYTHPQRYKEYNRIGLILF